jgi:FkbM family methyltransferase
MKLLGRVAKKIDRRLRKHVLPHPKLIAFMGLQVPAFGPHMNDPIRNQLIDGLYEMPEILAARGLVRANDRVLEMGTGLGVVSSLVSRTQVGVTVESYEANATLLPTIDTLHRINGITAVKVTNAVLVSGPSGTRTFFLHDSFAESSLHETPLMQGSVTVPALSFNEVVGRLRPDVLLCDIEGGEADLFNGIDMSSFRALIVELHPAVLTRQQIKQIYDTCMGAGFYPRVELSTGQVVAFERVT